MKAFLPLVLVLVLLPGLTGALAQGAMEECVFQVKIHVALTGPGATSDFAARAEKAAESAWNKGFKVGECGCEFKVDAIVKVVTDCS